MKKWIAIILSIVCALNLLACSAKAETAEVTEKAKLAGTVEMEKAKERAENKENAPKKKKIFRLESENVLSESADNPNADFIKEYSYLFANGSFDENLVWTTDDAEYSDLVEALSAYCEKSAIGSMMLATDEEIIFAGGFQALEADGETTVNPCTTYEIGSITQQFMAAAILQQIQEGNLKKTDTIDKFFPEYTHGSKITIEHLLFMESGIPDFLNESMKFFTGRTAEEYDAFMNGQMTDEQMLGYLYKAQLNFEPGKKASYSNTNYYLLALILEQVTGESYEEYLRKHLFEPYKLQHTTCVEIGNLTSVPSGNGEYMGIAGACRGAGDMHSNVCDILLWNRALLTGKVLDEAQLKDITEMQNGYACGFEDMGEGAIGSIGGTLSYGYLNLVYQSQDGNVYFIMMIPKANAWGIIRDMMETMEEYFAN